MDGDETIDWDEDRHHNIVTDLRRQCIAWRQRLRRHRKRTCRQTPETHTTAVQTSLVSVKEFHCFQRLSAAQAVKKQIQWKAETPQKTKPFTIKWNSTKNQKHSEIVTLGKVSRAHLILVWSIQPKWCKTKRQAKAISEWLVTGDCCNNSKRLNKSITGKQSTDQEAGRQGMTDAVSRKKKSNRVSITTITRQKNPVVSAPQLCVIIG